MKSTMQSAEAWASKALPGRMYATLFGIAGRAARLRSKSPRAVSAKRDGDLTVIRCTDGSIVTTDPLRIRAYPRGLEARLDALMRRYALVNELRADDVLLDVGANVGELSIVAARVVSAAYAVEPDPLTARCLNRNIDERRLGNVVHHIDAVLWKANEPLTFYSDPSDANSSIINETGTAVTRDAVTMDRLCADLGIRPTVLKMDVEGAEPEVLEGATETLVGLRLVAIDCGPERHGEYTHEPVLDALTRAGFTTERHTDGVSKNVVTGRR